MSNETTTNSRKRRRAKGRVRHQEDDLGKSIKRRIRKRRERGEQAVETEGMIVDDVFGSVNDLLRIGKHGVYVGIVEDCTPERALDWVTTSPINRNERPTKVHQFARDMLAPGDAWVFNGDTIVFNERGELINGHHRLMAQIESETNQDWLVVYGVCVYKAIATLDTGTGRKPADQLKLKGYKNYASLGSVSILLWRYMNGTLGVGTTSLYPSSTEVIDMVETHDTFIHDCVSMGGVHKYVVGQNVAAFMLCMAGDERDDMTEFLDNVRNGADLPEEDPAFALRRYFLSFKLDGSRQAHKIGLDIKVAVAIKAWNAWRANRPMKQVRYRRFGSASERFPTFDNEVPEGLEWGSLHND